MGADGYISIWRDDIIRSAFPDCDELLKYLPTHYKHELDGIAYHHCYIGDNILSEWYEEGDWWCSLSEPKDSPLKIRIREIVKWMKENTLTDWEVWT